MIGSDKIKSFQLSNTIKNDYIIRAVGSKINLERFYGSSDTVGVINELIELSQPNLDNKTIFVWPEGIIPNINQSEIKEFKHLFSEKFNENHLLVIGINSFEKNNNQRKFYNTLSIYDHKLNLINAYKKNYQDESLLYFDSNSKNWGNYSTIVTWYLWSSYDDEPLYL